MWWNFNLSGRTFPVSMLKNSKWHSLLDFDSIFIEAEKAALAENGIDRTQFLKESMEFLKTKDPKAYFKAVGEIMENARSNALSKNFLIRKIGTDFSLDSIFREAEKSRKKQQNTWFVVPIVVP